MDGRDAFGALLLSLRDAPGLLPRLQRIAGSLGVLKRLGPRQRTVLLRMAGLSGAEPLLEHLIAGDAKTREAFDRLLDDFEQRPEKLSETVRGLLDPVQRPQAAAALVRALEEAVEEENADQPPPQPAPEPPPQPPAPADAPTSAPDAPPAVAQHPAETRPEPEPPPSPPMPSMPEAEATAELPTDLEATAEPAEEEATHPVGAAVPVATAGAAAAAIRAAEPGSLDPEPAQPEDEDLDSELHDRREEGETLSIEDLGAQLDDEAPVWVRRRTLQTWIDEADPSDLASGLDRILDLVGDLASPTARMWCLTSLARRRPWDDEAWQRILAAAETPPLRRRLAHRRLPAR